MDLPRRQRPLAGVDQALGDGHARQPTELLEQLRDRLARLDSNHPSADRWPSDHADASAEPETSAIEEIGAVNEAKAGSEVRAEREIEVGGEAESDAMPAGRPGARPDSDRIGRDDPSETSDPGSSGDSSRAWSEGDSVGVSGSDHGPLGTGPGWPNRPRSADPYRPWFATGESSEPWFAE